VFENGSIGLINKFCHETDITHCTQAGRMILDNRHIFLSKLSFIRFRGYAASQFKSIKNGRNAKGKRKELIEKYVHSDVGVKAMNEMEREKTEVPSTKEDIDEHLKKIMNNDKS
jgi:hypothetical protein